MKSSFFETNHYIIDEKVNFFKFENCYQVYNVDGQNIGSVRQKLTPLQKALRLLLNKSMLPFLLEIKNSNEELEATISRGWNLFMSKITVHDSKGNVIGSVNQKFAFLKPSFAIHNSAGVKIADISGNWTAWNFVISDADKKQIGTINKKWTGAAKEFFTTADKYHVHLDNDLADVNNKITILSSAITVDMVLKESK